MKKRTIVGSMLLGVMLTSTALAQDMGKSVSLFADIKADRIGKGITVLVMEFSQASNDARTETRKSSDHGIKFTEGSGLLKFFPEIGVSGKLQNDFRGDARTTKRGVLKTKIAARIVGINEAGDYIIEGKRVIEINNEKEIYILTGAVRPEDIMADNTVYSYNIYDARIVYKGKGEVSRAQRAGILTRLLQWIF